MIRLLRLQSSGYLANSALALLLTALSMFSFTLCAAHAQQTLTTDDLINMLKNKAPSSTRSLSMEEFEKRQKNQIIVESVRHARSITVEDRNNLADIARENEHSSVDMEVNFSYNSAAILPEAMPVLIKLGQALSDSRLVDGVFMIAGHADAKGSDAYNLSLSQRRARSVKQFLESNFNVDPGKLIAIGYGEEQLKNRYNPEAAENRRVQIVNLAVAVAVR